MNIYEFSTPSDPITFKTDNYKVAFVCALLLGQGQAGCFTYENGKRISLPTILMFIGDAEAHIKSFIGTNIPEFFESNKPAIKACFESFCYGSIEERRTYDDAVEAITEPEKLKAFKEQHEDRNRTSISTWVKAAWRYAERIELNGGKQ